jgi:hypothetical protein
MKRALAGLVLTVALGTAAGFVARARAAGVPQADVLTYTGYLESEPGVALEGAPAIELRLFASDDAAEPECTAESTAGAALVAGRFQLALPKKCVDAVHAQPDLLAEVKVDGQSLGKTKLGAVPYALEAAHAVEATTAKTATAASGALDKRLKDLEAAASCPDPTARDKYGFCIWTDDNGARYTQSYRQAAATCKAQSARLCSHAEVAAAWASGAEWCVYSWVSDLASDGTGFVSYPMQAGNAGCHAAGAPLEARTLDSKYDANCCKP